MIFKRLTINGKQFVLATSIAFGLAAGCQEPGYRNEVTTNGQGAVEVHHIPKDVPAREDSAPLPPASRSAPAPIVSAPGMTLDQRIEALEAQVEKLNREITRLKLEKAAGGS